MNSHFSQPLFTLLSFGSGFKVHGSWFMALVALVAASPPFFRRWYLVSQPSPRGEGAPQGRIGHWWYEREWENAFQAGDMRQYPSSDFCKRRCPKAVFKSQITRGS